MSKANTDFYDHKKAWSRVKDKLLESYLAVYFAKVIGTNKPIVYIDCFAGAGKFNDGEDGSPRIALKARIKAIERSHSRFVKIDAIFIEPKHADRLQTNIAEYIANDKYGNVRVVKGKYEEEVPKILAGLGDVNLFLYVDPFGIKFLGNNIFAEASRRFNERVEFLLNFNSFGFVRNACKVLGVQYEDEEHEELEERDPVEVTSDEKGDRLLTAIAGGDYWKTIVIDIARKHKKKDRPCVAMEREFAREYTQRLQQRHGGAFNYVLNIPIRISSSNTFPKYRMVHATNNPDGCVAMVDDMIRRAGELYVEVQSKGEGDLFSALPKDVDQQFVPTDNELRRRIDEVFRLSDERTCDRISKMTGVRYASTKGTVPMRLNQFLARFFSQYNVICSTAAVKDVLKKMEKEGLVNVSRTPHKTLHGKESSFWSDDKGKMVLISRRKNLI